MNTKGFKFSSLFFLFMVIFSSCSTERKLAMDFIKQKDGKGSVMVVYPYSLDLINNKEVNLDSVELREGDNLDSVLFYQSTYLKNLSDSVFLESYLNGFIQTLTKNGFQVYLPSDIDAFRNAASPAYIFKFAQVELSEENYPYVIEEKIYNFDFHKTFDLNLIALSSWFEFEARDTVWHKVFYAENAVMDELNGEFVINDLFNKPEMHYKIDSLSIGILYQMATNAGELYAGYFTNFLLNSYVEQHFPKGKNASKKFQWDAELKMIFPYGEGFQEITREK